MRPRPALRSIQADLRRGHLIRLDRHVLHLSLVEVCAGERGPEEVRPSQIGAREIGTIELRVAKTCAPKVRAGEIVFIEEQAAEVHVAKIFPAKLCYVTPLEVIEIVL